MVTCLLLICNAFGVELGMNGDKLNFKPLNLKFANNIWSWKFVKIWNKHLLVYTHYVSFVCNFLYVSMELKTYSHVSSPPCIHVLLVSVEILNSVYSVSGIWVWLWDRLSLQKNQIFWSLWPWPCVNFTLDSTFMKFIYVC